MFTMYLTVVHYIVSKYVGPAERVIIQPDILTSSLKFQYIFILNVGTFAKQMIEYYGNNGSNNL